LIVPGGDHEFRGLRNLLSDHVAEALAWLDKVIQTPPGNADRSDTPAPAPAPDGSQPAGS
jgi:hypothetical protein